MRSPWWQEAVSLLGVPQAWSIRWTQPRVALTGASRPMAACALPLPSVPTTSPISGTCAPRLTPYTDAILALDLATGKILWSRQITPQDDWNTSCFQPGNSNCPKDAGPDYDFGSSPILRAQPDGHSLILAGQKSGVIYALDPDK